MRFPPNELVFNLIDPHIFIHGMNRLRQFENFDLMPEDRISYFSLDDFSECIGAPIDECKPILDILITEGAISKKTDDSNSYMYGDLCNTYCNAKVSEGLKRADAENLIKKIVARATEINSTQDKYLLKVKKLVVFGSYLTEKAILGDLDIGIETIEGELIKLDKSKNIFDQIKAHDSMETKIRSYIGLRKPEVVSVHELKEVLRLNTPYKVIFEMA